MNSRLHFVHSHLFILPFLLFVVVFQSSCTKDAEEVTTAGYPLQLAFDQLISVSEMRFFVAGSELDPKNNQQNLLNFLERQYVTTNGNSTILHLSNFKEPNADSYRNSNFVYHSKDQVRYVTDIINIERLNGVSIMKSGVTNKVADVPIVESDLFKYKFDINSNGTYNYQYIVHEGDPSVEVSLLYYKLVRYNAQGERKELAFGTVHNQFNEQFIQTLQARDTLAVKEYRLKYVVKE
ncbi:hypothetical protein [Niabella hibiscisoli]|uniref:hypothetical protein n=1 Tax=Niabella hibiscisoli TaxID=1825928 RepID=UPI001F0E4D61|nr:hypothetical protein [Niabella hibiscisoli]MCH5719565.1 hypothetical protein [Niabella hibiscisoli]